MTADDLGHERVVFLQVSAGCERVILVGEVLGGDDHELTAVDRIRGGRLRLGARARGLGPAQAGTPFGRCGWFGVDDDIRPPRFDLQAYLTKDVVASRSVEPRLVRAPVRA
jgi:hypothetical protein